MDYSENFEQWGADCVKIHDKLTGQSVPFRLNAPQRRVAAIMEGQRRAGKPIRLIMLKARQWGGSTLTQVFLAWMQMVRHKGWNSLICSHVKDASANIRGMYTHLLRNYPEEQYGSATDPKQWSFVPFEKSANTGYIPARDCRVTVTSAYAPDAVRGGNYQMAHLSEVAFWGDGDLEAAERIVRTVGGSIALEPDTVVVMESTADGEGNFFHREWKRAVKGESDKVPVFVPWHEIEIYTLELTEEEKTAWPAKFDDYELSLLHHKGLSVEQVAWYHCKRREYSTHEQMMAEYPTTPDEAFAHSAAPWLTPSETAALSVKADNRDVAERFMILYVGQGREDDCHIGVAERDGRGEVTLADYEPLKGTLALALDKLADKSASLDADCMVIRHADSEVSRRRLERAVAEKGLTPRAVSGDGESDEGESAVADLTPRLFRELRDCWHELVVERRWKETSEEALKRLRRLKATKGDSDPEVILRLATASLANRPHPPLSPSDFF